MLALLILACSVSLPLEDEEGIPYVGVAELWEPDAFEAGTWVVLDEVLVTSPRAEDAFYVQDRGGGTHSGARVELAGALNNWPPPVGTPVRLYGPITVDERGPVLQLREHQSGISLGEPELPTAVPWADDPALSYALVRAEGLRMTSATDPSGQADSTGPSFSADFGVMPPGYDRVGDATGIFARGRLSLRDDLDWTGEREGAPPVSTTIAAIRAGELAVGTPVEIADALQIAPWSRGGRWTAIQDGAGAGLWVDAEGWGVSGAEGELGSWIGEVRDDGEGLRLRTWTDPLVVGTAVPVEGSGEDGDRIRTTLTDLQGPDAYGDWSAAGWTVDDRFLVLDDLPSLPVALGIVRDSTAGEPPRLAVIALDAQ